LARSQNGGGRRRGGGPVAQRQLLRVGPAAIASGSPERSA
jgi:hypothetical protein